MGTGPTSDGPTRGTWSVSRLEVVPRSTRRPTRRCPRSAAPATSRLAPGRAGVWRPVPACPSNVAHDLPAKCPDRGWWVMQERVACRTSKPRSASIPRSASFHQPRAELAASATSAGSRRRPAALNRGPRCEDAAVCSSGTTEQAPALRSARQAAQAVARARFLEGRGAGEQVDAAPPRRQAGRMPSAGFRRIRERRVAAACPPKSVAPARLLVSTAAAARGRRRLPVVIP
jgi:hypothetical protein